ncbi:MAG: AtpZ/AtpI family protein [Alphaproteobacteria bacterium]|nr:AtpZ/AtpI family protein [Alphaproteobacteria bacterium]
MASMRIAGPSRGKHAVNRAAPAEGGPAISDDKQEPSLEELSARLRAARERQPDDDKTGGFGGGRREGGIGLAFRMGVEIVAAVGIGFGIGWLLDEWLGTRPWLMVVFFFFGAAAGMLNVFRTMSGIGHGVGYKPAERRKPEDDGRDR